MANKNMSNVYNGKRTFKDCEWLTEVIFSGNFDCIKSDAFRGCTGLEKVTIPEGVVWISSGAFSGCINLKEVNLPSTLVTIQDYAFENCSSLTNITFPSGLSCLEKKVFSGCSSLIEINLPEATTAIAMETFHGCENLEKINVDPKNKYLSSYKGILIDRGHVVHCPRNIQLTEIEFPETVKDIYWFDGGSNIQSITIPEGFTSLSDVFKYCDNLKEIKLPNTLESLSCKFNSPKLTSIYIPASVKTIDVNCFRYCENLANIEVDAANSCFRKENGLLIAKECRLMYNRSFENVVVGYEHNLTDVVIPEGVTAIAAFVFSGNKNIRSVTIQNGVIVIERTAFANCENLESVTIADSVKEIGSETFENCRNLTTVFLGAGVESLDSGIFYGCNNLKEIRISDKNENFAIEDGLLMSKDKKTLILAFPKNEIVIPSTIENFSSNAFSLCKREDIRIIFPENVCFNGLAIDGCENCTFVVSDVTKEINLPNKTKKLTFEFYHTGMPKKFLRNYTFKGVKKVVFPNTIKNLRRGAFKGCADLNELVLPDCLEYIESYAFSGCVSLPDLVLPDSMKFIGGEAFTDLKNLELPNLCIVEDGQLVLNEPFSFEGTKGQLKTKSSTIDVVVRGVDTEMGHQRYETQKYWLGQVKPALEQAGFKSCYWNAADNTFVVEINGKPNAVFETDGGPKVDNVSDFIDALVSDINNANIQDVEKEKETRSVCFTGTCPDYTRAELVEMAEDQFEVKDSVTKDLDFLVCADPNANSSKLQKAAKNGVTIISYDEFLEMLEDNGNDEGEEDECDEEEYDEDEYDEEEYDEDEYYEDENENNPLYELMDYVEDSNAKIDAEKVKMVEEAYGIKAPDVLKRMISRCGYYSFDDYISNAYQTCFRILNIDEVIDSAEEYKKKNCIPIAYCMNCDAIVYNYENDIWMWISIYEDKDSEDKGIYVEHNRLRVVLQVIDDNNG